MIKEVNEKFIDEFKKVLNNKPYFILDIYNEKRVIHNIQYFLDIIKKNRIKYIKFKKDYIYLININKTYRYAYGYYIKGMENW